MHGTDHQIDVAQNGIVAGRIREELARRNLSRQALANMAKVSISTLEKALGGARPFTLSTLVKLEQALDVALRPPMRPTDQIPNALGGYARAAVEWLEGDYLTLRPSFEKVDCLFAYRTTIFWDERGSYLAFCEADRQDQAFTQVGQVSLPHQSGHAYLVTNDHGQIRLITLGRPTISGEMFGLLSTLQSGAGGHLFPVATPVVFVPLKEGTPRRYGRIMPEDTPYSDYRALINRAIAEGFVRLIQIPDGK